MKIKELIYRARMQVGDTSKLDFTDYQFLEYYNEGNQLIHMLMAKYLPHKVAKTIAGADTLDMPAEGMFVLSATIDGLDYVYRNQPITKPGATIEIEYVPSAGYKDLEDESGYFSEIESMLVQYMVSRILKVDTNVTVSWDSYFIELARQAGDGSIMRKGYYDYECRRVDYAD